MTLRMQATRVVSGNEFGMPKQFRDLMLDADKQMFDPALNRMRGRPTFKINGRMEDGRAVLVHVVNFMPYFYVACADGLTADGLYQLKYHLESQTGVFIYKLEIIEGKRSVGEFDPNEHRCLKVTLFDPRDVNKAKEYWLEKKNAGFMWNGMFFGPQVHEADVKFNVRLGIDSGFAPHFWIDLPEQTYLLEDTPESRHFCDVVACVDYKDIVTHKPEGEFMKNAPQVVLGFDIECDTTDGTFPRPERDHVIMIGAATYKGLAKTETPDSCFCFTWGRAADKFPSDDFRKTIVLPDEKSMMLAFTNYVVAQRPDSTTGYNSDKFDWMFLYKRAEALGILKEWARLCRSPGDAIRLQADSFQSKARGGSEGFNVVVPSGWEANDVLRTVLREKKERSYKLDYIAGVYLKDNKVPLPHTLITPYFTGSEEEQHKLREYCIHDTMLAIGLFFKFKILVNQIEMCRITGVDIDTLITSGQQSKVHAQILKFCLVNNYVVPTYYRPNKAVLEAAQASIVSEETAAAASKKRKGPLGVFDDPRKVPKKQKVDPYAEGSYQGATVLTPKPGYYTVPITTLDFSSLYPSIMIQHNLCYATHVKNKNLCCKHGHNMLASEEVLKCGCVEQTPHGDRFVTPDVRDAVLGQILTAILSARSATKAEMKKHAEGSDAYAILDGRQLALKISANSVYGFTGTDVNSGKMPCQAISASVTAYGREMIEFVKEKLEKKFQGKCLKRHDLEGNIIPLVADANLDEIDYSAEVVYGDTDSVMVKFGVEAPCPSDTSPEVLAKPGYLVVRKAIATGKLAAKYVNALFTNKWLTPEKRVEFLQANLPGWTGTVEDALFEHIEWLCDRMTAFGKSTISIVFEKVLYPYLITTKKKYYIGGFWLNELKADKVHASGDSSVRRDRCLFVSNLVKKLNEMLTTPGCDPATAAAFVLSEKKRLLAGCVDLRELAITKAYGKKAEEYAPAQQKSMAHLIVNAKRIARSVPGAKHSYQPFAVGERVPYVMVITKEVQDLVKHTKNMKAALYVEDLDYAIQKRLQPWFQYYLGAVEKPLANIFDTIYYAGWTRGNIFTDGDHLPPPERSPILEAWGLKERLPDVDITKPAELKPHSVRANIVPTFSKTPPPKPKQTTLMGFVSRKRPAEGDLN